MKIAIIGSRNFQDYNLLKAEINKIFPDISKITCVISGGAKGTDTFAEKFADENNIPKRIFLPKFKTDKSIPYHPKWFFERNKSIIDHADLILAFWDQKSSGTKHAIEYSRSQNKPIKIFYI